MPSLTAMPRTKPIMAVLWNLVLVGSLLVQSAPQRCSGADHGSLDLRDVKFLAAMQVINEAVECISDSITEGLRLQQENSAELVQMMKEQMNMQNENIASVIRQLTALHRVLANEIGFVKEDALTQENAELKNQLEKKGKMVDALSQEVAQLKYQLGSKDKMVRHLEESVAECQQLVSDHANTEELLRNKVAAHKNGTGSALDSMPHHQEIIRLVHQYSRTKDWGSLRTGLETVLDRNSQPYIQLQRIAYGHNNPLYDVGLCGSTRLASLLLDAGLHVDTYDAAGYTMLHGAAWGGHLELVKLLLDRGAGVDVRDPTAYTPLINAAAWGRLEVVKYLVSAGADATAASTFSRTALDYARVENHTAVVQYLQPLPH